MVAAANSPTKDLNVEFGLFIHNLSNTEIRGLPPGGGLESK